MEKCMRAHKHPIGWNQMHVLSSINYDILFIMRFSVKFQTVVQRPVGRHHALIHIATQLWKHNFGYSLYWIVVIFFCWNSEQIGEDSSLSLYIIGSLIIYIYELYVCVCLCVGSRWKQIRRFNESYLRKSFHCQLSLEWSEFVASHVE